MARQIGKARRGIGARWRGTALTLVALLTLLMVGVALAGGSATSSTSGPTITSDKADYQPGETVTLTGAGWAAGEVVHIVVNDTINQSWQHTKDVTADTGGNITDVFDLPAYFISDYDVTATGPSGTATWTFTDLSIGLYDQCSNDLGLGYGPVDTGCRWTNGNLQSNNSLYREGEATVQRLWLTDLLPGSQHSVTLKYGTTKGGKHAYDYLTTWNYSENWITDADLCQDMDANGNAAGGECTLWGADDPEPIPVDPNPAFTNETPDVVQPAGRNFTMRNGTMGTPTTPVVVSGTYAGDSETVITVPFTVGNDPDACVTKQGTTTCSVALWFGAHIARSAEWASGGAASIDGSPYHVALDKVDNASVGQRDNQMQSNTVVVKTAPEVSTELHNAAGGAVIPNGTHLPLGSGVYDVANLTDPNSTFTGTVTFNFYSGGDCTTGTPVAQTGVLVSGTSATSSTHPNLPAGDYAFNAQYIAGSDPNHTDSAVSDCEPFHIDKAQLAVSTTVHDASHDVIPDNGNVPLGTNAHDNATVTGGVAGFALPATSFTFDGAAIANNATTEAGFTATSIATGALGAGDHEFNATVASNANYIGATSADEPFTVDKKQLAVSTTVHDASHDVIPDNGNVPLGTNAHDNATVTGGVAGFALPATSFTFDGAAIANNATTEAGFTATSIATGALGAGDHEFNATVASNANYIGATSADEPFTVDKKQLAVSTTVHDASHDVIPDNGNVPLGTNAHDNATVTGGVAGFALPATSFTFDGAAIANNATTEAGFTATSIATGALGAGDHEFNATVASNANYIGATSADEPFTVDKKQLAVSTTVHDASHDVIPDNGNVPLGTNAHDNATVTGGVAGFALPATSFTFDGAAIANNATTEAGFTATSIATGALGAGDHEFNATVASNANYIGATSADEPFTVDKASTTTKTTASDNGKTVYRGTSESDTATVTGEISGFPLTGNVTFYLCQPGEVSGGACPDGAGTKIGDAVDIDASGNATSASTTDTNTDGLYCWRAVFTSTSDNYTGSSELTGTNECFRVSSATIIIKKIIKPEGALTSFVYNTTGLSPYHDFSLAGGQMDTQGGLNAGSYTVKELVPLGWVLTGIGGSTNPNTPYNCTVTGSGGSTGVGDLNTQTATISLKLGDTVTCVFENTGQGVTRTQGFWATHPQLAQVAWFGGTAFGHTFPGVANTAGIGNITLCGRPIDTLGKLMGGFWSDVAKKSTGVKRTALDQARMQLLQQLLAAELNASAFGSVPNGGSGKFAIWEAAFCGTNQSAIQSAQQGAASFNSNGDSGTFTPGTSANSKLARQIANYVFWNYPAGP